jgi:two-component system cell cycle response regulator DivK
MTPERSTHGLSLVGGRDAGPTAATILLVDDQELVRALWKEMLVERLPDVKTVQACNGAEAVWVAHEAPPDLILMDINMPVMSGFDAVKWLKQDDVMRSIPVIAVTGFEFSSEEMLNAGCAAYISKPLTSEQLIQEVLRVIGRPLRVNP